MIKFSKYCEEYFSGKLNKTDKCHYLRAYIKIIYYSVRFS